MLRCTGYLLYWFSYSNKDILAFARMGRKVRAPQGSIAANGRRFWFLPESGQVQQKECTGNAVVKSGKLYAVKCYVNLRLRVPAQCRRVNRLSASVTIRLDK